MPLDLSGSYLSIFVDPFDIDYSLPKYNEAIEEVQDDLINDILEGSMSLGKTAEELKEILKNDPNSLWNYISASTPEKFNEIHNKLDAAIAKYQERKNKESKIKISSDRFDKLNSKDLLILSNNTNVVNRLRSSNGDLNRIFNDMRVSLAFGESRSKTSAWKRIKGKIKDYLQKNKDKKEQASLIDPIEFFKLVKLTTEEAKQAYVDRSQPYLLAIERAESMGQKALVDQLLSGMFVAKYESIFRAAGFGKSITEEQLVSFIKKSKKGVQLSYIKNFARNIPENVIEIKKKVDELYIFDNYCVLYYDSQKKAYLQTSEEQEKERQRKADPILFGMIFGSRKLYYIADWVDEFCDLTLEEFLKVSGLTEKDIEIPKTIEI